MGKKVGILTGGGDCAGLNAAIEAVVKAATRKGWQAFGIKKGWDGLISGNIQPLGISDVEEIHLRTGTVLQTSRTNPYNFTGELNGKKLEKANVSNIVMENAKKFELDAIIACGGNDTLSVIPNLIKDYENSPVFIGIPKTMDGDLQTHSLGLDTAINRSMFILEEFKHLLEANSSIGVVEFFGRHVGRVAFKAGIAAGADAILIPEIPIDLNYLCSFIAERYDQRAASNRGNPYVLIAVAEGAKDPKTGKEVYLNIGKDSYGHGKLGGIGDRIAKLIHDTLKDDPRIKAHTTKLDIKTLRPTYNVRGGRSSYSDSYAGQKLGAAAIHYLENSPETGVAIINYNKHGQFETMPIEDMIKPRYVHLKVLELCESLGFCFGRKPKNTPR